MEIGVNSTVGTGTEEVVVGPSNIRGGMSYVRAIKVEPTTKPILPPQLLSDALLQNTLEILNHIHESESAIIQRINELEAAINNTWYKRLWRWTVNLFKGSD